MDQPLVSVITVSYNSSEYINEAIGSILNSSFGNFELIIGDDASTDNTWKLINNFNDDRIIRYRNEVNIGEYPNRNKAINIARGKYLLFVDGDDMIYPHGLEFMVKHMDAFSDCAMGISYNFRDHFFYPVELTPKVFHQASFLHKGFNDVAFTNTIFRTSVLKHEGGLPLRYKAGDTYIRLLIGSSHNVLLMSNGLTWWRKRPGQATELLIRNFERNLSEYVDQHFSILESGRSPLDASEKKVAKNNVIYVVKRVLISNVVRFRFRNVMAVARIMRKSGISIREMLFSSKIEYDPFDGYNSVNVRREPFSKSPFSALYKRTAIITE